MLPLSVNPPTMVVVPLITMSVASVTLFSSPATGAAQRKTCIGSQCIATAQYITPIQHQTGQAQSAQIGAGLV